MRLGLERFAIKFGMEERMKYDSKIHSSVKSDPAICVRIVHDCTSTSEKFRIYVFKILHVFRAVEILPLHFIVQKNNIFNIFNVGFYFAYVKNTFQTSD